MCVFFTLLFLCIAHQILNVASIASDISCEFHLYYLQIFIVFVDYNERNDLLEPVNPNAEQVPIRRETVRSLMDSMGNSFKGIRPSALIFYE